MAGRVASGWLVALLVPELAWAPLTRAAAAIEIAVRPGWRRRRLAAIGRVLPDEDAKRILASRVSSGHVARLWGLKEYTPWRPRRRHRLEGSAILEEALDEGRGAILWVGRFVFATLETKVALRASGLPTSHLSRPTHGFGESPFAVRTLNPIWNRVEERYASSRIVMGSGSEVAALRALRRRLAANEIVSISVGDEGARSVTVPFLNSELRVATGPITLAAASGAPLLPVFTTRDRDGVIQVGIQRRLEMPGDGSRAERSGEIARRYAARLAEVVERHPDQWLG